jgi:pSer/pThr/pTyr-binding forkhead associated (FHA) protein
LSGADATVEDLGSKNGTYLHGERLESPARLQDGDELRLGSIRIKFRVVGAEGSTDTASRGSRV